MNTTVLRAVLKEEKKLAGKTRIRETQAFIQHGSVSVYVHCICVAYKALELARTWHIRCDETALIRGALLHDYFLYDWHNDDDGSHRLHGFTHAETAWRNASREITLSETESNIIRRHMFPLTFVPPGTRESWLVCFADKFCALRETLNPRGVLKDLRKALDTIEHENQKEGRN